MTILVRAVAALTLLAFATPALPCGDKAQNTTASAPEKTAAPKVATKSGPAAKKAVAKKAPAPKPATATN